VELENAEDDKRENKEEVVDCEQALYEFDEESDDAEGDLQPSTFYQLK
jgi:hypothetical protein